MMAMNLQKKKKEKKDTLSPLLNKLSHVFTNIHRQKYVRLYPNVPDFSDFIKQKPYMIMTVIFFVSPVACLHTCSEVWFYRCQSLLRNPDRGVI